MKTLIILGLGRGLKMAESILCSETVQVVAAVDTDEPRRADAARLCKLPPAQLFSDVTEALAAKRADILLVATPTQLHKTHAIQGLEAGLHVLCEKPLALTRDDAMAIRDAARKARRQVAVVQNMRYASLYRACRELISRGEVGDLSLIEISYHRWRPPRGLDHAVLFNHGSHHLDVLRYLAEGTPVRFDAIEWDPSWATDAGSGRFLRCTVMMQEGWAAAYNASYGEAGRETSSIGECRIVGSRGTLEVRGEPDFNPELWLYRVARATGGPTVEQRMPVEKSDWRRIDRQIIEEFAEAIEDGRPAETDIEDNLLTLEWLFQVSECIARRRKDA